MDKKFIIRCKSCRWSETSTGISADLKHLNEIKRNCNHCGGPRKFKCPKCGMPATMMRIKGR